MAPPRAAQARSPRPRGKLLLVLLQPGVDGAPDRPGVTRADGRASSRVTAMTSRVAADEHDFGGSAQLGFGDLAPNAR